MMLKKAFTSAMAGAATEVFVASAAAPGARHQFIALLTDVKVEFNLVPRPVTVAMIATEMPAAIKPYSIAVAPSSLRRKLKRRDIV
jgi:hypothetical protein